jgi:hypothetical protein
LHLPPFRPLWPSALPVATRLLPFYKYILSRLFLLYSSSSSSSHSFSLLFLLFCCFGTLNFMLPLRVFRGQCRAAALDWWLEGGKNGGGKRIGPSLTKDLQYTLGPSLECVCVNVLPVVFLFFLWPNHLTSTIGYCESVDQFGYN